MSPVFQEEMPEAWLLPSPYVVSHPMVRPLNITIKTLPTVSKTAAQGREDSHCILSFSPDWHSQSPNMSMPETSAKTSPPRHRTPPRKSPKVSIPSLYTHTHRSGSTCCYSPVPTQAVPLCPRGLTCLTTGLSHKLVASYHPHTDY